MNKKNSITAEVLTKDILLSDLFAALRNYIQTECAKDKELFLRIQNYQLDTDTTCPELFSKLNVLWKNLPVVPSDFIVWRGGEMNPTNRTYLSTSYDHDIASSFGANPSEIHLLKGSKIFPSFFLDNSYGEGECEIIINKNALRRIWTPFHSVYEYK